MKEKKQLKIYEQGNLVLDIKISGDEELVQKFINEQMQWLNNDVRCYIKDKTLLTKDK
jgi:deoxyadenosine/deoxycytidine kinase